MSLVLNGTTGITSPGGDSAAVSVTTPLVTNAGTLALSATGANIVTTSTNGTERMRITSGGNVGIGTSSPGAKLQIDSGDIRLQGSSPGKILFFSTGNGVSQNATLEVQNDGATTNTGEFRFSTRNQGGTLAERMRIDSSGNLLVNATSQQNSSRLTVFAGANAASFTTGSGTANAWTAIVCSRSGNNGIVAEWKYSPTTTVGSVSVSATTTTYNTSSDYRLKHDIAPMTGALAKVAQLKPVTYKWNADDSQSQGFIAHELQEVVPECVTGEKDAVDAEGKPVYQGIDTSFLVATLTAAIQELKAELDTVKAELATLKGATE